MIRKNAIYGLLLLGLTIGLILPATHTRALNHQREVSVPEFSGRDPEEHPILAPCSRYEDRYDNLLFRDTNLEEWPDIYHTQVSAVVQEYMEPPELTCTGETYEELFAPGPNLLNLAAGLPPWDDPEVPLSRFDTPRVLIEYLRVYECALMEFSDFQGFDTAEEEFNDEERRQGAFVQFFDFFISDLVSESAIRARIIQHERTVARKTLQRVLTLAAAAERMRPLEAELTCMQRMSLDMRNIASLTAETSSCLPRVWNAKDVLRDYKEEEQ